MIARDGCRLASVLTASMARSVVSGRGATTTSVRTLVRVRTRTSSEVSMRGPMRGSPMSRARSADDIGWAATSFAALVQILVSCCSISRMLVARPTQREVPSPVFSPVIVAVTAAATVCRHAR